MTPVGGRMMVHEDAYEMMRDERDDLRERVKELEKFVRDCDWMCQRVRSSTYPICQLCYGCTMNRRRAKLLEGT